MEINDALLLAIHKDSCFALPAKYKNYDYVTKEQLMDGVRILGIKGYVRSNIQTSAGNITFGEPGSSLDVEITSAGMAYLREKGLL